MVLVQHMVRQEASSRPSQTLNSRHRIKSLFHFLNKLLQAQSEDRDLAFPPVLFGLDRAILDRPGITTKRLFTPDSPHYDAQVPAAQSVSQKQQIPVAQFSAELRWHEVEELLLDHVVDIVVLGYDKTVFFGIIAIHRAMYFQDHRALGERKKIAVCLGECNRRSSMRG